VGDWSFGRGSEQLLINFRPVTQSENLDSVFDAAKNDAVVPNSQAVTAMPFAMQRTDIAGASGSESCDRLQYTQGNFAVNRAELRPRFRGKAHAYSPLSKSTMSS
jgi:hypothetical protein